MNNTPTKYRINRNQIAWSHKTSPDTHRLIGWLHDHCEKTDTSIEDIAKLLKQPNGSTYSGDSVYQALTGRRKEAQLTNFLDAVRQLEKIERDRSMITRVGFIKTNLTKRIWDTCDAARNFGKIMFVIGRSHIGKTTALKEYSKANNHGSTIYLRAPAGGALGDTLYQLCADLNISRGHTLKRKNQIINAFNANMILIVDEAHQFFFSKSGLRTIEYIREIHDRSGCGVVFSATEVFQDQMETGEHKKLLSQLKMRSLIQAKLPDRPTLKNLTDFAAHFSLPPAKDQALDLQTEIIRDYSLGRWLSMIEGASKIAAKAGDTLEWRHVLQSHAALLQLELGD